MGRTMPTVGRVKITRQAGSLAVGADVDVLHRTINTVETSTNNILLATADTSEKKWSKNLKGRTNLKHWTPGCLRAIETEDVSGNWRRGT